MNCVLGSDNILNDTVLYRVIYEAVGNVLPCGLSYVVAGLAMMMILVNGVLVGAGLFSWVERRLIGRFHNRIGPNRWGPFGLLQPMADLVKLLTKEDLTPKSADRLLFAIVPVAMLAPVILTMAVVPFAKDTALANLNVGVLYILAVTSITSVAIFMAGWASDNRYAMFGASRGVAVLISYEVPVVMSLLGVVLLAGSMSLDDVVSAQNVPFLLVQPMAFFVFLAGISAELNRTPFDLAEAESELIAGFHTEYSGVKFALIQAAEFGAVLTSSAVIVTLFLSGWSGPFSEYFGWAWFLLKIGVLAFMFSWVRATLPRLRIDQLLAFAWKFLLPLSIINLFATALEVYFLRDDAGTLATSDLWVMAGINFGVAFACLIIFGTLIKEKVRPARLITGDTLSAVEAD
ncbi:MAG: NADH-quinone oxidoreductase subunit H [Chloroflexota bacterium]|jgi:NADH-quinone oxidoreductase subunit H|nr:NADH-quinone oxidoreductase subunit NuoH [Dehalococcoidia bacterium]MEC9014670.1 NADH-quinone oxidoreductase subunit NuoH [Chloroflexota bacterium]MEE3013750.1 NADH-quinone oxidoreductase subunit NuoH [Chloroflexota bacterium]GIS95211.1 MAG: NADH-quinone oxidoreductase subunit H [Dehalococcoidia bacterium]GIT44362.1 MAG: NADH-quinone oxidoreductase subunit H [Chloroflexota bacterium]|tara:strand:+ start:11435 stop:12646 length:1212 start_codon:yes stop_codon:yes gene_type:complete